MENKNKKKINWKITFKNNAYMLGFIARSSPSILILTLIRTILNSILSFVLDIYLFKYALNALQAGKQLGEVLITLGIIVAYTIAFILFGIISEQYLQTKYPKVETYIQDKLQKKATEVELSCFENSDFYDKYVKATGEASNRAFSVMNNIFDAVWCVLNVAMVGVTLISIDPIFVIFSFIPLLINLLIGKRRNRIRYDYTMRTQEAARQKDYVRRTFYLADFSKEMRLTEMWRVMFKRMHDSVAEMKDIIRKYGYTMMWFRYLFDFIFDIVVYSGSIVLAAYKTLVSKTMLLGDCFVVINSVSSIAGNIYYVGDVIFRIDENSLYIDNLRDFLEYETKIPELPDAPPAPPLRTLELRGMSFSYDGQPSPALHDVNLTVNAGEKIAIVGHNGAGKTTLIKLLLRLYDPSEGEILLNGENIKSYRLSSYRAMFGTVFQDFRLFAVSVAENVMLRGGITDEDKEAAADALRKSGIYDKISEFPLGTETTVTKEFDEEGAVFSGGEAQKISISRIFAGEHEIVIMDEPTSALDPIAEQEMYRNMFEACRGKTVIFISHRLSSATMADRIYMFEHGEIIEKGTHGELLALGAKYADMWHKQADSYTDGYGEEA